MSARITAYYRKHDDFRRYTAASKERIADLSRLYRKTKRYFGRKVLDLACGGGPSGLSSNLKATNTWVSIPTPT